jgi:hypothetical protein
MQCRCEAQTDREHVADGLWVRECRRCDEWVVVTRRQFRRRLADTLYRIISRCAHPDDIVFAPWLPF